MNSIEQISAILSFVVLIGAAAAVIYKCIKPTMDIREMVKDHDKRLADIERHEKNDLQALDHIQYLQKKQLRTMVALLNHSIDGNGIAQMKATRDEIMDLIAEE